MNNLALINPEFLKFSEDIQQRIYERIKKGDKYFFLMRKEEIEKELEEEEKEKTKPKKSNTLITLEALFDTQVSTLLKKEFPKHAEMSEDEFLSYILPLKGHLKEIEYIEFKEGHIPFIVVVSKKLLSLEKQIPLMEVDGEKGFTSLNLSKLKTAEGVEIPESLSYLIVDIENGKIMLGKSVDEAGEQFKKEGRFPLTVEEGVAVILQYPGILQDHYMDLPGSRCGDVMAVYLMLRMGNPELRLGFPSSWNALWGSASCLRRL